jgi:hypothetical protein
MSINRSSAWTWLAWTVLVHLVVTLIHGRAHAQADVPLSGTATVFVFVVIVAGPLVGLLLTWRSVPIGSWVIAVSMAAAFVFGLVNHFVLVSPDHVAHVNPQWRPLFTLTAVLLVVTESAGFALAIRVARHTSQPADVQLIRT